AQRGSEKDRAGSHAGDPSREMDALFSPDHLARTQAVHGTRSQMRRLPTGKYLPCGGQDVEHGGDSQECDVGLRTREDARLHCRVESRIETACVFIWHS